MNIPKKENRQQVLEELTKFGGAGMAEGGSVDSIPRRFYPVSSHLRMLDPDVVLVVGPRGAGKTEIVRALTDAGCYSAISHRVPAIRLPQTEPDWKRGHPLGQEGFDNSELLKFLNKSGTDTDTLRDLWFSYLFRLLSDKMGIEKDHPLMKIEPADIESNMEIFRSLTVPVSLLDKLDQKLERENRFIFITYDEIDTFGGGKWKFVEAGTRSLVAFWAAYARRWKRIRAKIFLRTDLYNRHAKVGGADLAKLAANRVDLSWSDKDLYGMLLKRMRNSEGFLAGYTGEIPDIKWDSDKILGELPSLDEWQDAQPLAKRLVGEYMGPNRKKGLVYRWLLDHVRDGLGRAFPRPFVRLIEEASIEQSKRPHGGAPRWPHLLDPSSLRQALDSVSHYHVNQSLGEWKWLEAVKDRIKGKLVPWRMQDIIRWLEKPWGDSEGESPPFEGRDLLDYLIEVGILRYRPDRRIDAPDLFLAGLGLMRKGGVRKRHRR